MRKTTLVIGMLVLAVAGMAQDIIKVSKAKDEVATTDTSNKRWFISGTGTLAFSQASFTNWAAGGQNSVGLNASANLKINYRKGKHAWGNTIGLGYGFNLLGKGGEMEYNKTNDRIELTSAYGFQITQEKKWLLTVLANFRTQFSNGYNYPNDSVAISTFMAPGYLVAGLGMTYAPQPWFYLYMSPASGRFTFVLDTTLSNRGEFGVDPGKSMLGEFGIYVRGDLNKDFTKSINLATSLELFTNYLKDFGNIDVNWYLQLNLKVNKWLATSITTQLIYDDNVTIMAEDGITPLGPRTQFKEILGVGLTYSF